MGSIKADVSMIGIRMERIRIMIQFKVWSESTILDGSFSFSKVYRNYSVFYQALVLLIFLGTYEIRQTVVCISLAQDLFAAYEKVKYITLLAEPFTLEKGELTETMKLKRRVINEHYAEAIEKM